MRSDRHASSRPGRLRREILRIYRGVLHRAAQWTFPFWQRIGLHIVRNDYESPIPDTRTVFKRKRHPVVGVDFRLDEQLALLQSLATVAPELNDLVARGKGAEHRFYFDNDRFNGLDAAMLWCLLRTRPPRIVVEVGSGMSTWLTAEALQRNAADGHPGTVTAIEPYPPPFLESGALEIVTLLEQPVEDAPMTTFTDLQPDDVLFIDSSHVLKTGNDVQYLYLEVLPRLPPGIRVHIHDIFLPWEYPREWVIGSKRFWTEQYLLQAFLTYNDRFQVEWASHLIWGIRRDLVSSVFPMIETGGGSFWMRTVG